MLNFGIIGTSWITDSFITSAHATSQWTLSAVYSRKEESAREFASKYTSTNPNITLHTSLSALAADTSFSAIYIASPNILHFDHAKQMLSAGKHVILEKPACSSSAQLDSLFALAREKGVFLLEAWRHIQEANFKTLRSSLDKIAPVKGASLTYAQFSSRYDKVLQGETPNIFNPEMGGGALVDLAVYTLAAAVRLFGAPLDAHYYPVMLSTGADGGGHLVLKYEGFFVHLCGSKMWDSGAPSEVYGDRGTLSVPTITDIERVTLWDPRRKERTELGGTKEVLNLKEEAQEFARIINDKDWETAADLEAHSRAVLKVTEKVRRDNGLLFPGEK